MYEGRRVTHRTQRYRGVTIGTTRMRRLFENPEDVEEIRVRTEDGSIEIASPENLIDHGPARGADRVFGQTGRSIPQIIDDINEERIPDEWLTEPGTWSEVCRARGLHFNDVDPDAWASLCTKRGYLLRRQNPRGF